MGWTTDPNTGQTAWDSRTGEAPPEGYSGPVVSGAKPSGGLGQANSGGAGGMTPTAPSSADPMSRVGQPVPGKPGYTWQYDPARGVVARVTDENAARVSVVEQGTPPPPPNTNPGAYIDPATGRPIGQPPPRPATPQAGFASVRAAGAVPAAAPAATTPVRAQPTRATQVRQTNANARFAETAQPTAVDTTYRPTQPDFSGVDREMEGLRAARDEFYGELERLRGVDPFGNQALLQKATDRAVAQAAGTAAGARGGAAAQAGAQRQAVGVQSQLAARGAQDIAAQKRADELQAAQLGLQTIQGIESIGQQLTGVELKKVDQMAQAAETNLKGYLGGRELDQAERNSLRQLATQMAQIDMQRYQTDVQYRQSVNDNLARLAVADKTLQGVMAQVEAQEGIGPADWLMGITGLVAGTAGAAGQAGGFGALFSDRRVKTAFAPAKARDLDAYLRGGKGEFYEYRSPSTPGQRPGLNFGPMAQNLQKSKIGRTVVVEGKDGLYVDTGRLALADHSALSALARRVERLARKVSKRG